MLSLLLLQYRFLLSWRLLIVFVVICLEIKSVNSCMFLYCIKSVWSIAWHYIWVDRNFNQQDREEIIFTAEDINKKLLELSFERKAEVDALIAENDALSVDRRLDALYSCLVIKRGAANLKLVRGLAPPAHFNAKKWFQHIALLLKAGGFESLATDAETFSMIVEFDVITEIGGANVLDKRATATAPNTLATDGQASHGGHASWRSRLHYRCGSHSIRKTYSEC